MNETAEALGEFVVAGCEASRVFKTIEATFDAIPQSVNRSVDLDLNTPIFLRGNDRRAAALLDIGANGIRVVPAIEEAGLIRGQLVPRGSLESSEDSAVNRLCQRALQIVEIL